MLTLNRPRLADEPGSSGLLTRQDGWALIAFAVGGALVQAIGTHFAAHGQPDRAAIDALAVVLLIAGPLVLVALRRRPVLALWLVIGVTLTYLLLNYPYGPVFLSVVAALFTAVIERHRLAAVAAAGTLYVGCFGARYLFGLESTPTFGQLFGVGAWLVAVLAASEVARMRRTSRLEAERIREQETQRRRSEERLRIARELHDVLAHHISLINVQAGVALHLMDKRPEQAQTALTAIEGASREALDELRAVLDILHQPEETAPRAPAPGLAGLDGLAAHAEAAGLSVRTEVEGAPLPLPASVDVAAFRIIQEALTNVIRHASATTATIRLQYAAHELTIEVADDGNGAAVGARGGGKGLTGMRERAAALRGSFEAGPLPAGGFRVRALLPTDPS